MTSGKKRLGISIGGLVMAVLLATGCERSAAQDPLEGTSAAGGPSAETPATTESLTPVSVVVTTPAMPAPSPTAIAAVTNTPAPTPVPPSPTPLPLTPASALAPGGTFTYTVKAGDWLFSIGRQFKVNPFSIAAANNIAPPYTIRPGQLLVIPTAGGGTPPPPPTCSSGKTHLVQLGENLYRISLKYGTTVQAIATANNISNHHLIFAGRTLCIP